MQAEVSVRVTAFCLPGIATDMLVIRPRTPCRALPHTRLSTLRKHLPARSQELPKRSISFGKEHPQHRHVDRVVGFDEPTVMSQDGVKKDEHPLLEDLIAEYGDSMNTGAFV
jgi:hypothetical protein